MEPRGRRHYILYASRVRYSVKEWLESLQGQIPSAIYTTLLFADWEAYCLPPVGLRVGVFMLILYFFESNDAPLPLRRMFWNWILPKPIFNDDGTSNDEGGYVEVFKQACLLDAVALAELGAFYNVVNRDLYSYRGTIWRAFNIWHCSGIRYDPGTESEPDDDTDGTSSTEPETESESESESESEAVTRLV